jgi:arabinogalactan oligomer/maltooligosaccharide transport system permease protein
LRTWTLGLYELQGNFNSEWGLFAAGSVLISVPVVLLFLYSSKYMISGLTLGGVKG